MIPELSKEVRKWPHFMRKLCSRDNYRPPTFVKP